jgi:hypothetical protein
LAARLVETTVAFFCRAPQVVILLVALAIAFGSCNEQKQTLPSTMANICGILNWTQRLSARFSGQFLNRRQARHKETNARKILGILNFKQLAQRLEHFFGALIGCVPVERLREQPTRDEHIFKCSSIC